MEDQVAQKILDSDADDLGIKLIPKSNEHEAEDILDDPLIGDGENF